MPPIPEQALLAAAGFFIGIYSTALGAGGAFVITPLLLLRYPNLPPAMISSASVLVVVASSGLSAVQSLRRRLLDYRVLGLLVAIVVPCSVLGAAATQYVPRRAFELGFAALLVSFAAYVVVPRHTGVQTPFRGWRRFVTDREGHTFTYVFRPRVSLPVAAGAAFLSSMAGIGGGPLYTPLQIRVMRIPVELAIPMAHVVVTALAISAFGFHLAAGNTGEPLRDVPWLIAGMLAGNPIGRRANRRVSELLALRLLAAGMVVIAVRTAIG